MVRHSLLSAAIHHLLIHESGPAVTHARTAHYMYVVGVCIYSRSHVPHTSSLSTYAHSHLQLFQRETCSVLLCVLCCCPVFEKGPQSPIFDYGKCCDYVRVPVQREKIASENSCHGE